MDVLEMFEQLAEHGMAPREGCHLFGAGYDQAFEQLKSKYLIDRFGRGLSGEKFVIGPFGSGKTHFLRQLMEMGRELDCATIEVALNRNIDLEKGIVIYQEMARQVRAPGQEATGMAALVTETLYRIRAEAERQEMQVDAVLDAWIEGLPAFAFAQSSYGKVLRVAFASIREDDADQFRTAVRWLEGEVTDKAIAKRLDIAVVTSAELQLFSHHARLALYQFVRQARYRGTIVGFDEAEQGMTVEKRKMARIFSHLLAEMIALSNLRNGSVLVIYAVTPDMVDKISLEFPMIHQRTVDPAPDQGFFDGNALAPRIDLTMRGEVTENLERIGNRLVELFFDQVADAEQSRREEALAAVPEAAREVARTEAGASARRDMVRRVCAVLVNSYRTADQFPRSLGDVSREAEV